MDEDSGQVPKLTIFPRSSWNALPPIELTQRPYPVKYVFCMNTMSTWCYKEDDCKLAIKDLQIYQMKTKKYRDLRFNFMIGGNGMVFEARGWGNEPMLPFKYGRFNRPSLLLGFMGKYKEETLPRAMADAREAIIMFGIKNGMIAQGFRPYQIFNEAPFEERDDAYVD